MADDDHGRATVNERGDGGWEAARADGIALLERGEFVEAAERLQDAAASDPTGQTHALLGLAHFHSERYSDAADSYAKALDADGDQPEWASMLAACRANAAAEVDVHVPDVAFFERSGLLSPPPDPRLPSPPHARPRLNLWRRVRYIVGHAIGSIGGTVMRGLVKVFGKNDRDEVWTNWYRKRLYFGMLTLAHMRDRLNARNLHSTYPAGANIGFLPAGLDPPAGVTH